MADFQDDTVASVNFFELTNLPLSNVTMDQTIPMINSINIKSPVKSLSIGAAMSSGQGIGTSGKTMKECEDQLNSLKKENFNLKLRIYFLEERMGITSADEDAIQKNIELKVENESLRKELNEKQELLSQAAKAIELIKEQKQVYARNQVHYQQTLQQEQERVDKLKKELEECRERLTNSTYYEETYGITPENVIEYKEKFYQVEEIKSSLESELKQLSASLEEEKNWAQELKNERDQLRNRLESEIQSKEKLSLKRDREMENLNEKIKESEEKTFKIENLLQQLKKEITEKDKIIIEKSFLLEEKCTVLNEITKIADKRKKQIDQLRLSVKSRDDALTDLNNRNRFLLAQFENNYTKSNLSAESTSIYTEESQNFRKTFDLCTSMKSLNDSLNLEHSIEESRAICSFHNGFDKRNIQELKKELDDKDREIKKNEEIKQLMIKLYDVQQSADITNQKLKKLEIDHRKAIQMIQGFVKRHEQLEDKQAKKDRRILDLEVEVNKLRTENTKAVRSNINVSLSRSLSNELIDNPENDYNTQQQFEEMESKMNNLQDQTEAKKSENFLEKRIQMESEELKNQLQNKNLKIESFQCRNNLIDDEFQGMKGKLNNWKIVYTQTARKSECSLLVENLQKKLMKKNLELEKKSQQIDKLTKELLIKTQNLQKLVNTELWSKNKEIAKLHNHMTMFHYREKNLNKAYITEESATKLNSLIKELNDIGMQVTFTNDIIKLNYVNSDKTVDITTITNYVHKLFTQKNQLEKKMDYLKWLKFVSKSIKIKSETYNSTRDGDKQYCKLLRMYLKELIKFISKMLKNTDQSTNINIKQKEIVFDMLMNSRILSDDVINVLNEMTFNKLDNTITFKNNNQIDQFIQKSKSNNFIDCKHQFTSQLNSKTFSKADRMVSLARIELSAIKEKSISKLRFAKLTKTFNNSEDSIDCNSCHESYQNNVSNFDANWQIFELKRTNNYLYYELNVLKNEIIKNTFDDVINIKLSILLSKLEKSQNLCEELQTTLEKKIHECHILKKKSKQNKVRKIQLKKKPLEIENITLELTKQKTELVQGKTKTDRNDSEILISLNKENEMLKLMTKRLKEENKEIKTIILRITKELDNLALNYSQILVENTKLTNEKLKLEQEVRKIENQCDLAVRTLQKNWNKKIIDLNQINELHRTKIEELETTNKEFQEFVVICNTSDSLLSTSGISSFPVHSSMKEISNIDEYTTYNNSENLIPITYLKSNIRSKLNSSPDLGIESDAAVTSRPFKNTLKITESMNKLLNDDNHFNNSHRLGDIDDSSPIPVKDLNEIQMLKQENIVLKRRLMKTRQALEDTFQYLSASNKNKKNVEKEIIKQLMITKNILKKTKNYEYAYSEN